MAAWRRAQGRCRPADRNPVRVQGHLLHGRRAHDLRVEDPRQFRVALRRHGRRAARRGGRRHGRQDQHGRVRHGLVERDELLRPGPQSLGPRALAGRLFRRLRRRRRGRSRAGRDRHGHGRLDPPAGGPFRHHGLQADLRARLALRHDRFRLEPRPGGRAHAQRGRRGAPHGGDGRLRSTRLDQRRSPGAAVLERDWYPAQGPAHRRAAGILRCGPGCAMRGAHPRGPAGLRRARRRGHRRLPAASRAVGPDLLHRRAGRGLLQPGAVRRGAFRAPAARRPGRSRTCTSAPARKASARR